MRKISFGDSVDYDDMITIADLNVAQREQLREWAAQRNPSDKSPGKNARRIQKREPVITEDMKAIMQLKAGSDAKSARSRSIAVKQHKNVRQYERSDCENYFHQASQSYQGPRCRSYLDADDPKEKGPPNIYKGQFPRSSSPSKSVKARRLSYLAYQTEFNENLVGFRKQQKRRKKDGKSTSDTKVGNILIVNKAFISFSLLCIISVSILCSYLFF